MASQSPLRQASPAQLMMQAVALEQAGRLVEARWVYQNLLGLDGSNVGALVGLGRIALRSENPRSARPYFEKAVKIQPKSAELRNQLANALLRLGRPDKAEAHALISHKLDKNSVDTLKTLYEIYYHLDKPLKAQFYLERALRLRPGDPSLTLALAQNSDVTGDVTNAETLYRAAIASGQESGRAFRGLAFSQTFTEEPPELAAIEALLSDSKISPLEREKLHRACGKIADDLGLYDRAFAHLAAAGQLQAAGDTEAADKIQRLKETLAPQFYSDRADFANKSQRPIFVFGMPRSGTTLVEQILASHPQVCGAGELRFFAVEAKSLAPDRLVRAEAQRIAKDYLHLLQAYSSKAARVVDKMPYNFERLWLLALLFPNASFIHCRRDPLATCVSCFVHYYACALEALGQSYRQYHDLMDFWRRTLPVTILDVDYEALIQDLEGQSRRLVAHVGLEWNESCVQFHLTKRPVRTPSRRQVVRPVYASSLASWRRYEKHLQPLVEALGDLAPRSAEPTNAAAGVAEKR